MKIGTKITKKNLPKCNGRPQLWIGFDTYILQWSTTKQTETKVRIIYPNGTVLYNPDCVEMFYFGCTSSVTQKVAQLMCVKYRKSEKIYFGGYL